MEVASDELINELYELAVYDPPPKITKHDNGITVEKVYVKVVKPKDPTKDTKKPKFKTTKKHIKPKKQRKTRRRR
jgi:hypothetical protein